MIATNLLGCLPRRTSAKTFPAQPIPFRSLLLVRSELAHRSHRASRPQRRKPRLILLLWSMGLVPACPSTYLVRSQSHTHVVLLKLDNIILTHSTLAGWLAGSLALQSDSGFRGFFSAVITIIILLSFHLASGCSNLALAIRWKCIPVDGSGPTCCSVDLEKYQLEKGKKND